MARSKRDAVGHRYRSGRSVVIRSPDLPRDSAHGFVHRQHPHPSCGQRRQGGFDLVLRPLSRPKELVDHLRQVHSRDGNATTPQLRLDLGRGDLACEGGNQGERVEDHPQGSRRRFDSRRSSARDWSRSRSDVTRAGSRIEPIAAEIGSAGRGRTTSWSPPASSMRTLSVCHRRRTAAGIEIWPPFVMRVRSFMNSV